MRIVIDIGHPAHVHYFRNFIKIMERKGHEFLVIARDRQYVFDLLTAYEIDFVSRGTGGGNVISKIFYLIKTLFTQYFKARKFNADLFLDFGTIYSCLASSLSGKPHIVFEDTENATLYSFLYKPFVNRIFTPECFEKDFGKKQVKFSGYMELCYLHPAYFTPDSSVLKEAGVTEEETFSIVRFVNWQAVHDIGLSGLSSEDKDSLVDELLKYGKVFISSEIPLPHELEKYRFTLEPDKLHSLMYYASIFVGESATMTSEAIILGTPAVFIDKAGRGYTRDLEKRYGVLHNYTPEKKNVVLMKSEISRILTSKDEKKKAQAARDKIVANSVDVTAFMVNEIQSRHKSSGK